VTGGPAAPEEAPVASAVAIDRPLVGDVRDLAVLGAANVLALNAFGPAFGGWRYLLVGGIGVAVGSLTAVIGARLRWPVWVVGLITVGWFLLLGPAASAGFGALDGALPTPIAVRDLVVDATRGWHDLLTTVEPVGSFAGLLAIPWTVGLVAGTVSLTIARRARGAAAWAAVVPVVVLGLGVLEGTEQPAWALQGAALLVLLTFWGSVRQRAERVGDIRSGTGIRWLGALGMLAAAALVGAVASQLLSGDRTVVRRQVVPPRQDLVTTSPLEEFRTYRKTLADKPVLRVDDADGLQRIRLATLDGFDGESWQVLSGSAFQRTGPGAAADDDGNARSVEIEVLGLGTRLVPTPDGPLDAVELTGADRARTSELQEGLRFSPVTGSFADVTPLQPGDRVRVDWSPPPEQAVAGYPAGSPTPGVVATEGVPTPDQVVAAAGGKLDGTTPLEKLLSFQRFLTDEQANADPQNRGYLDDGTPAGAEPKADDALGGHSLSRINSLLTPEPGEFRTGNEEQFASAIAVAATQLGFPTRVVMGFTVPSGQARGPVEVAGRDVTAWVEVDVDGAGWTPVLDTRPGDGDPPSDTQTDQLPPEPVVSAPPPPTTLPLQPRTPRSEEGDAAGVCAGPNFVVWCAPSWVGTVGRIALPPILVVGGFTLLMALLKQRRRFRRRTTGTPDQQVAGGWMEVCDLARDMGDVVPIRSTRRETAVLIGRPAVGDLARSADALVFGPGDPGPDQVRGFWTGVETTRAVMLAQLSWWERWKATVNPTSLWRRSRLAEVDPTAATAAISGLRSRTLRQPTTEAITAGSSPQR
jgi:hypothetical protein